MTASRDAAVAGVFYPDDPRAVQRELDRLMPASREAMPARAVIAPHAGWAYSGAVAGETYAQVAVPRLAVLLGPNHRGRGAPGALAREGAWRYPGAEVPVAGELADALIRAAEELEDDPRAHHAEHCLEVQLPFLHRRQPDLAIVPIVLGRVDPGFCRAVGEAMGRAVAGWPEPVLVVDSTDLDHYEPQAVAERKDRLALDAILALDPAALWRVARDHDISMCGLGPTLALLWAAPVLGVGTARLVRHATSGDVTGDHRSVVGYAGLVLR